jgi:hypothetical protein
VDSHRRHRGGRNFEIDMKSDLLEERLRLNVTLFGMTCEDMQIRTAGQDQNDRPARRWTGLARCRTGKPHAFEHRREPRLAAKFGEIWIVRDREHFSLTLLDSLLE